MSRAGRDETPDRLYTLTGGRSKPDFDRFDLVTLVVSECEPKASMSSEDAAILRMCRAPTAVVEIAAELRIPVGIATILLSDLLHAGKITVRHPSVADSTEPEKPWATYPDRSTLEKVLVGLRNI
ncbi:DUF742 domain-containing protein [Aldersonia kunmingensis]|uniref:DUF742 domain-containing protein n=1 Tax=Aldersonia kunmingensis TaxID=408066 RepID=UPI00082A09E1|nr:DUF742 domain-containing protein [Aldersonia kunmingensis]